MSPALIVNLIAAAWVFVVLCVALDVLLPLLIQGHTPQTPRKLLRLAVLSAGLMLVLRVAASLGGAL